MELRIAGGGNFADLSRQVLANAGYLAQRRFVESGQFVRVIAGVASSCG